RRQGDHPALIECARDAMGSCRIALFAAIFAVAFASADRAAPDANNCYTPVSNLDGCLPCPQTQFCRKPLPGYQPKVNGCGPEKFTTLINKGIIPQGWGRADFRNGGCSGTHC